MSPLVVSLIVLLCIFGSSLGGLLLRPHFPDGHLNTESKEVIKLVVGIVGTMTGMVLGLLVASAKSSFDSQHHGVSQLAANVVVLDRALAHYGPETQATREALRKTVTDMIERIWAEPKPANGDATKYEEVYDHILALQPKNESQRTNQALALKVVHDTAQMRWLLYSQRIGSIPPVFLILLVAWLAITFGSYGLFAPRNATTIAVLLLGSLVVSSAVFLILELDRPFGGIMHISSQPLRNALAQVGQ
ncbi:bestrophin-like domain [Anatilimnocola floriformis]|uniref:bestrophin-like domain n=1 Tax=Anatilimnocola floriformis TaxID=2948575 RepID=UPI0020C444CA|nr:DUF4239 domain-containing protein [Anatilimnocola floriformis]